MSQTISWGLGQWLNDQSNRLSAIFAGFELSPSQTDNIPPKSERGNDNEFKSLPAAKGYEIQVLDPNLTAPSGLRSQGSGASRLADQGSSIDCEPSLDRSYSSETTTSELSRSFAAGNNQLQRPPASGAVYQRSSIDTISIYDRDTVTQLNDIDVQLTTDRTRQHQSPNARRSMHPTQSYTINDTVKSTENVRYPCPFFFLHCFETFETESDWANHAIGHFYDRALPKRVACPFPHCTGLPSNSSIGPDAWAFRMQHVADHHRDGEVTLDGQTASQGEQLLFMHLSAIGVVDDREYNQLRVHGTLVVQQAAKLENIKSPHQTANSSKKADHGGPEGDSYDSPSKPPLTPSVKYGDFNALANSQMSKRPSNYAAEVPGMSTDENSAILHQLMAAWRFDASKRI
ncbi:hypothetical protein NA57DRAFT_82388 [Rhizodiscina lignyota]|uniref:Uncharacterized protein n=1 Tax=Rhizodiscina lignyota TaxID=1504668 RepID=A0A9P4I4L0_9PEZI|nr:hypothetical protein NA57DRAFT_82388 [Rhizodiscina lignyota]